MDAPAGPGSDWLELEAILDSGEDPIQETVASVWREVLGVDWVAADDDFFHLGGDSLRLLRVTTRLGDLFGLDVPVDEAYAARRLRDLTALLEDIVTRDPTGS
jgi:acyl carrier protein